jgi:hypothetical protein
VTAPVKLAAFAAALALLFGGGALAGGAVEAGRDEAPAADAGGHGAMGGADGDGAST